MRRNQSGSFSLVFDELELASGTNQCVSDWPLPTGAVNETRPEASNPSTAVPVAVAAADTSALEFTLRVSFLDATAPDRWSWSSEFGIPDESARQRLALEDRARGCEKLVSFVVLRHRRVSHVIFFHDVQPPRLVINMSPFPLQFQELVLPTEALSSAALQTLPLLPKSAVDPVVFSMHSISPGQVSELVMPHHARRKTLSSSSAQQTETESSNESASLESTDETEQQSDAASSAADADHDPSSASFEPETLREPGWSQEEEIFSPPPPKRWMRWRIGAHAPWSLPVPLTADHLHVAALSLARGAASGFASAGAIAISAAPPASGKLNDNFSVVDSDVSVLVEVAERRGCQVICVASPTCAIPRLLLPPAYAVCLWRQNVWSELFNLHFIH
jgi:hypothetical protein